MFEDVDNIQRDVFGSNLAADRIAAGLKLITRC